VVVESCHVRRKSYMKGGNAGLRAPTAD
jgi:hypothetical protein